jgi:hypothetical protein
VPAAKATAAAQFVPSYPFLPSYSSPPKAGSNRQPSLVSLAPVGAREESRSAWDPFDNVDPFAGFSVQSSQQIDSSSSCQEAGSADSNTLRQFSTFVDATASTTTTIIPITTEPPPSYTAATALPSIAAMKTTPPVKPAKPGEQAKRSATSAITSSKKYYSSSFRTEECVLCMASDRDATFVHTETGVGHTVCCMPCALEMYRNGRDCPICRQPISFVIRNYSC